MPQVAAWYQLSGQPWFTVVECPRRDCEQRAKAYNIDGPWKPWEGPVPTGSLAQLVLEERPFMEALLMQWNHAPWLRSGPRSTATVAPAVRARAHGGDL